MRSGGKIQLEQRELKLTPSTCSTSVIPTTPGIFRGSYNRITTGNDRIGKSHPREAYKSSRGKSLPNTKWEEPSTSLLEK